MAKENSFKLLAQVRLQEPKGIPVTSNLGEFPPYVLDQLSQSHRTFLLQLDMEYEMDYIGNIFTRKMDGLDIFERIRKGGGQNGK